MIPRVDALFCGNGKAAVKPKSKKTWSNYIFGPYGGVVDGDR